MPRVLHVLSQCPARTGSGTTLEALARHAARAGWTQAALVGLPRGSADAVRLEELGVTVSAVEFAGSGDEPCGRDDDAIRLPFAVPGMSDVMPYESCRFSQLDGGQLAAYRDAWTRAVAGTVARFAPDVVHSHHVWIASSLIKDAAPGVPVVTQCHATGLRQMRLCPHLAEDVVRGVRRNDRFVALHEAHAVELAGALDIPPGRISVVGAGYREDVFTAARRAPRADSSRILYAGKYSSAKGVPQLLDAFGGLARERPGLELHVAGSGAGSEAEALRDRMERMPGVVRHGQVDQSRLAELMRSADVFVLPSLYEGLPLVLVEALACGCRLVATALPGIEREIAPRVGDALIPVPLPRLEGVDRLAAGEEERFVSGIRAALVSALDAGPVWSETRGIPEETRAALATYGWSALFERVEAVWLDAMRATGEGATSRDVAAPGWRGGDPGEDGR